MRKDRTMEPIPDAKTGEHTGMCVLCYIDLMAREGTWLIFNQLQAYHGL